MKTTSRLSRWLWGSVVGIGLVSVSVALFYFLKPNSSVVPPSEEANFGSETEPEDLALQKTSAEPMVAIEMDSTPTLTFPIRSVEEACGIHEFPLYWDYWDDLDKSDTEDPLIRAFASEECREALRARVGPTNPYLWGYSFVNVRQFAFVVIESPLTFDRIFSDPSGDFARVQHALSQSECLLENGTAMNLELKESCNADALLNYALLNRYCFQGEESNRVYYGTDPIPEESERLWIQDLEELWVTTKCKEFDSELKLTADKHSDLTKSLSTLAKPDSLGLAILKIKRRLFPERPLHEILPLWYLISTLIELAARLGDDAASLTSGSAFDEQGVYLGRFQELESNPSWQELRFKREPSQNRLLQSFNFLTTVESMDIEFDWEWLVRHLCEPPYPYEELDPQTAGSYSEWEEESTEPQSCRTVTNELYTEGDLSDSLQEVIEQFENTALELDLFD